MKRFALPLLAGWMLTAPVYAQSSQTPAASQAPAASPSTPAPQAPSRAQRRQDLVEARIKQMHTRLQITKDQEPVWTAFAQVMRDNASATARTYQERADHMASMNALENLRSFTEIEQTRVAGLQKLVATFEPLYDSLSDQQKQIADTMFRRRAEHPPHHVPTKRGAAAPSGPR